MSQKIASPLHAYEHLTPDVVLDALASVGLLGDGRIMALSSYENRVYQIHLESPVGSGDLAGDVVVAKFYRPDRWSDAQIVEEHDFATTTSPARSPLPTGLSRWIW
jgi:Ser/Thr protein kinase RdoA (MazF antagonist)